VATGFQQGFGKNSLLGADYLWKYTHSAFDFSIVGNTPIFFPIDCHNSRTQGFVLRADLPSYHHFSAFVSMSSVSARIDHDEKFNETIHVQYQIPATVDPGSAPTGDTIADSTRRQPLATTSLTLTATAAPFRQL
jgi:hypothetical protein